MATTSSTSPKEPQWHRDVCTCEDCKAINLNGRSSIEVLLAWLTYEDPMTGRFSKLVVCTECAEVLKQHGFNREAGAVKNKLIELTQKSSSYCDFMSSTGEGVMNELNERFRDDTENPHYLDQVSALEKRKLKICRYYQELTCWIDLPQCQLFTHSQTQEEPDDDGSVEEPSYNPGTPTKEHHSYNPGTPPKPVMPLVQKSQSIVDLRNATSGASRPADNQHVRMNKRIKLLGEETKENPRLPMPLQME
ncbi:hypothetical protein Ae201684_007713 [Aphanomyces euteiches]|uniref:Uncharacterized protein n=1 Tax=Aphanomyces euteiches TaxID=100861 RepID=A0A6G0X6V1_9STRA|nr:hypothetical protein Ae201684_007713 [Aphanomyces euteiches]